MNSFLTIIKSDYLQRTRSYAFLVTLCASLAIAYTFVPEPNANYSTIRIADHVGYYNSAWFGYVTAIMTSVFLSLIGFYLVNSGVKKDIETKIGQIIASTSITNFKYLLSKILSNFLVLLTIVVVIFIMSIALFILYNDGFTFELIQFIKPYLLITIPAMFFVSTFAVIFEVLFGKYSLVQNIGFFFLFTSLLVFSPKTELQYSFDVFGSKIVLNQLEETVRNITKSDEKTGLTNIGYVWGNLKQVKKFEFNGIDFPTSFIISRIMWMLFGIGIITLISRFFHRFNIKERVSIKKTKMVDIEHTSFKERNISKLPNLNINYGTFSLLKTELLLLFRKGKKWLWLLNILGMVLLAVLPLKIAHQIVLPILWFFQVSRLSDITTKETTNNIHYFAFTSYKPIGRLFLAQLLSSIILILVLAIPLIIRLGVSFDYAAALSTVLGGIFIVLFAALLGVLSRGEKLFEVIFFMITYANINSIPFTDYFGGFEHQQYYLIQLAIIILLLGSASFLFRIKQLRR